MDRLVIILILIIGVSGCKSKHIATSVQETDSTHVEVITKYVDTTITTDVDSAAIKALVICDTNGKAQMPKAESKGLQNASLNIEIIDGILTSTAFCDSLELKLEMKNKLINTLRSKSKTETKIIVEKHVPDWVKFFAYSGGLFWIALIILVIMKIK